MATNSAVFQCYVIFVIVTSVLFLGEKMTTRKGLSLLACLCGLVTLSYVSISKSGKTGKEESNTIGGLLICLCAAWCYAITMLVYG